MGKSYNYQPAGELTVSTTGNVTDLDPQGCAVIRMTNASLTTIQGIKSGFEGQILFVFSDGAGEVDFAHQSSSETIAASRLQNYATTGVTPLAAGVGSAAFQYSGAKGCWVMVSHDQGDWIFPAYSAGDYGSQSGTWTVTSGNMQADRFYLSGRKLSLTGAIGGSVVTGTPNYLSKKLPYGYTAAPSGLPAQAMGYLLYSDAQGAAGNYGTGACWVPNGTGVNVLRFYTAGFGFTNWTAGNSTNSTSAYWLIDVGVG